MNISHLEIGQASVPIVSSAVRNLGSWFDVNLKMTEQINNKTCQSVYCHLHNIRQIRKFFTPASTKLLVQAVIMERIKLQRLQNSAARLITHTPRYLHITPVLLALHWLPVKFRICYKIAVISFKAIYNLGPAYLSNLINIMALFCKTLPLSSNALLGTDHLLQLLKKIWNGLPDYIRKENDFGYV